MIRRNARDERGSLPMVLLAAIILGGAIAALYVTVQTGTDTARRDRDWHAAVQVADAGVQHAFVQLRDLEEDADFAPCDDNEDGTCSGSLGDTGSFVWEYERVPGSETQWQVCSRGAVGGSERQVCTNVGPRQVFPAAMLAKTTITYNGGGGGNPPFTIGSFGSVTINGNPANSSVNTILRFGPGPHTINTDGSQEISTVEGWQPGDLDEILADNIARCADIDYDVYPADVVAQGDTPGVRGQVYCVGRVEFNNATHSITGTGDEPVIIVVRSAGTAESFRVRTQARVNWPVNPGDADDLLIFVESGAVTYSANSYFSGGVFAPNSTCNATGNQDIVGSLVCNDITVGGTFGYGSGLSNVTEGPFRINQYWEGVGL